ncbi:MAG: hypothetical protein PHC28_10760 [Flavobacterium sp.]|uniref:hypothetical protein n=1 Tax=Flavobacterium sp. TaxID=239 RepID=UPI00262BB460|nr:hypothetical protein [Flavobacterium sp.]MDD5150937.1 hypothetical protein [Flavobacterium sp.]
MKKNATNLIVDTLINYISIQNPLFMDTKRIIFISIFSLFGLFVSAQSSNTIIPQVLEVNAYISSLKTIEQNSNSSFSNSQNIENLVSKLQSSVYFNSGGVKTFGENPKNLYTDIDSLNGISSANLLKNNIEIVIINIRNTTDLNSKIDLAVFSDFYKLKYIYIVSNIDTTGQTIAKMFINYDEQYTIFYKIEKGE